MCNCQMYVMSGGKGGGSNFGDITSFTSRFEGRRGINPDIYSVLLDILGMTIVTCAK